MTEPQVLSLATLTLITTMQPKGFIDLTEGNFHFSKPVEMAQGVFIRRWGEGDLDRPTIIHYQEGTDPVFPLFRGSEPDGQDMPCPACGHVLVSGLTPPQITGVYLECDCGEGLDLL